MTLFKESFAIMEKETKLNLRFKFSFVVSSLTNPVLALIPFLLVYYGFFHFSGATSFAEVNQNNYVNFLVLGMLVNAFFYTGLYMFYSKFMNEKYWKTMEAIFLTPINYLSMVFGISASEIIRMIPTIVVFMGISALFIVPNPLVFLLVLIVLFLVFLISSGIGLIHGSAVLANENFAPIFGYFFVAWTLFSCFFYPIGIIPEIIRPIAFFNPIYQGVFFIREAWIDGAISWTAFFYVLGFAMIVPIVSVKVFKVVWRKLGITGY